MLTQRDPQAIATALAAPFDPKDVKWKPQMVKNNRCLATAYIDARLIQDRLDEVLGVENWEDVYKILPDGSVMCRLRLKLGDRWIAKTDVGSQSEQPDNGDRLKAAFSDALKRAAVKFGIGRYLYRLPSQWVDYDPVKKQIVQVPQLRAGSIAPTPAASASKSSASAAPKSGTKPSNRPLTGAELGQRLANYGAKLAAEGICPSASLMNYIQLSGLKAGFPHKLSEWGKEGIDFSIAATVKFEKFARALRATKTPQEAARVWQSADEDLILQKVMTRQRDTHLSVVGH